MKTFREVSPLPHLVPTLGGEVGKTVSPPWISRWGQGGEGGENRGKNPMLPLPHPTLYIGWEGGVGWITEV